MDKPMGWEVTPDEYLGQGTDGMRYYRLGTQVYRTANGYTSWVCTETCWRITGVRMFMEVGG